MAKLMMISVKDKVTGEFLSPFYTHNKEEAARVFKHMLTTNEIWKDNPDNFEMYSMGILDTNTGNIISVQPDKQGTQPVTHPDLIYKGIDILS